jgi:hypothetical protein
MNWLREKYGDRVISAVLHLDEATPHLQFLILPLDDNGRLNCGLGSAVYAPDDILPTSRSFLLFEV